MRPSCWMTLIRKLVAPKLFFASFVNSGQVCMAVKRIYAHERIYDALCDALAEEARKARVGDGLDPQTQYGPIQNQHAVRARRSAFSKTRNAAARAFIAGGELPLAAGLFLSAHHRRQYRRAQSVGARGAIRADRPGTEIPRHR